MLNYFRYISLGIEEKFLLSVERKSLKALKNKRARLREKVAFAKNEAIRRHNLKLLEIIEDKIRRRWHE